METLKISAQMREHEGVKGVLSKIRAMKQVPAVVYGIDKKPLSIVLTLKDLATIQKSGSNVLVELDLGGKKELSIVKEVQYHVVTDMPIHVDFLRISMDKPIETVVPVVLTGECIFAKTNGDIVDHTLREVSIKSLPGDIPHNITVDVTNLDLEHHVTVGDLVAPKGVTILGDPERMVVHVMIPKDETPVAAPAATDAAAAAAEPELSATKGKKDEEGAAAPAAGAKAPAAGKAAPGAAPAAAKAPAKK